MRPHLAKLKRDPLTGKMIGILTAEQVREIKWYMRAARVGRSKRLAPHVGKRLAAMFRVSPHTIEAIRKGKNYAHVKLRPRKPKCSVSSRAKHRKRAGK